MTTGLTKEDVLRRVSAGFVNSDDSCNTKSIASIIRENLFTLFNFINFLLAVLLIYAGSYKNLLFLVVVITNFLIGVIQEIRAKCMVDKLKLVSAQTVTVLRDGKFYTIKTNEIVIDDVVCYSNGQQIAADGQVIAGSCEVNESFLTGEPDSVCKKVGDSVLSGSFLVSGDCKVLTKRVGKDNYSSKILKGVKNIKSAQSEIMRTTKKIIKFISIAIIPVSILLFYKQFFIHNFDLKDLIIGVSGAIIGMIPEGLVLLISTVLSISVVRLSKRNVLVQDIYCIETLARVDTLCFDKTGTLTDENFEVVEVVPIGSETSDVCVDRLKNLVQALNDSGHTFQALQNKFNPENKKIHAENVVNFSSERKFSGAFFKNDGCYVMGAPEVVFKNSFDLIKSELSDYADDFRVLIFAYARDDFGQDAELPENLIPMAFILLKDKVRSGTKKILEFFRGQNVNIKIISGDNAFTVEKIAKDLGISGYEKIINLNTLKDNKKLLEIADKYTIFGRATPEQKQILLKSLKLKGHVTAMVGDGVNDVLALKEADCSISFANGSDAARNVSHLVLLDSKFTSVPKVVAEGRRSINNIQRSATLFLNKTIYSVILAMLFVFINAPYPFIPIQMSLISAFTIGIPSFFLALEPNFDKINGNLFKNILKFSIPGAIITVFDVVFCALMYASCDISDSVYSTMTFFLVSYVSFLVLYENSSPFSSTRKALFYFLIFAFFFSVIFFSEFFSVEKLPFFYYCMTLLLGYCSYVLFKKIPNLIDSALKEFKRRFQSDVV